MTRFVARAWLLLLTAVCAVPDQAAAAEAGLGDARVQLSKVIIDLAVGTKFGYAKYGFCLFGEKLIWNRETFQVKTQIFEKPFREAMVANGITVPNDPASLFENENGTGAQFLVGVKVNNINMQVCYPNAQYGDYEISKGDASVSVEFQIYSTIDRRVLFSLPMEASISKREYIGGGYYGLLRQAFGAATSKLAQATQFKTIMTGPKGTTDPRLPPPTLVPVTIKYPSKTASTITEVIAATAVIFSSTGDGSGFLVGEEGYVLTNHHVIGDDRFVKIRWSDRSETLGEVLRSDKGRDIALIKTDAKGRLPIGLRKQAVIIGEDIYAVGAPTGEQFQSSVTKGIVSATRLFNGFNFIQSDVGVTYGNSGGPIIDSRFQVVGVTDLGIDGAPMINLFIPIEEAMSFLGLESKLSPQ